jgi:ABC-type sugar transport system substrate-binding protein
MSRKKLSVSLLAALILCAGLAAQAKLTIGATLMDAKVNWFQWVRSGMEDAAKKYGAELIVINTNGDPSNEISTIENFIQRKVNGIAVGAASQTASAAALTKAASGGIKVIAYNSLVGKDGQFPFVGVDNKQLGALNGQEAKRYINANLGGKAKVAVVYTPKYGAISLARSDGFEEVMKTMPGVKIAAKQIAEDQAAAESVVQNILTANPDLNIIFCWNESSFEGALSAVKTAGKTKQIKVFGVDMSPKVTQAFQTEEDIGGVVTQEPVNIGYAAVEEAILSAQGKKVQMDTRVPVVLVTNANLADFLKTHPYYVP